MNMKYNKNLFDMPIMRNNSILHLITLILSTLCL